MPNRIQFIKFNDKSITLELICSGIQQGSLLVSFALVTVLKNHLKKIQNDFKKFLDLVKFGDDPNLFYCNKTLIIC